MKSAVFTGQLMHNRLRPRRHHFSYRVNSWLFDLDELEHIDRRLKLFSLNRFNLVSFWRKDYGARGKNSALSLKQELGWLLEQHGLPAPRRVELLCYPRVLGYVFNPLSVYFCYQDHNTPSALVYEVSNTFGERHSYVIPVDGHPLLQDKGEGSGFTLRQSVSKRLHVSPFFATEGLTYRFRIATRTEGEQGKLSLAISLHQGDDKLFGAVFQGQRQPVSDRLILAQSLALPLMTLKVIAAIHWQALRLWLKGMKIFTHKPASARFDWSRGHSGDASINNTTLNDPTIKTERG